jgi:hypothetical protein
MMVLPRVLRAQDPSTSPLAALAGTPLGALLPAAPPMPTSRDNLMVFGVRGLYGWRDAGEAPGRLTTYGLGGDVQFQGRTLLSGDFGVQRASDCLAEACPEHRVLAAMRLSGNLVTTRPFLPVPFFTENNATGSAGFELAAGWGSRAFGDRAHWSANFSVPLSLSVGQRFRVVPFALPTLAVVWGTSDRQWSRDTRILVSGGLGVQEVGRVLGIPGVDLTFSAQRAFMPGGTALGFTLAWTHVP